MISIQSYVRQGHQRLRRLALDPKIHRFVRAAGYVLAGFCLSAGSLAEGILPLGMALVCACKGWPGALTAAGATLGYWVFWGSAGYQGMAWVAAALAISVLLGDRKLCRTAPLLLPAIAALTVATGGVLFQSLALERSAVPLYLLRVGIAFGATWLFTLVLQGRNPLLDWIACGVAVLALAQLMPIPYLGLGYLAAGALVSAASFPAAALSGLALDLAQVTPVPMTAVMSMSYLVRFLPRYPKWMARIAPGAVYLLMMTLSGNYDLQPVAGLVIGGIAGSFLPGPAKANHRRGETGAAQVRLEMAAGALAQTEQLLLEAAPAPVDEQALIVQAAERACGGCPYRKNCKDNRRIGQIPGLILEKPLLGAEELPIVCRKSGRFLAELHRAQERLRAIHADRQRQREYRAALVQQYRFLSEFLQDLSDQLARRITQAPISYTARVSVYSNRTESENGDRCSRFAGVGGRYYVLLCDGMGSGPGAVQEGQNAAGLLRRLLTAGYPPEHALRSLNSLCALRDRAGATTVDLAELRLDTGKVTLYKWGAAPSYLVSPIGAERLGVACPPPGLSVTDCREQTEKFSLRRGQQLILLSDGIGQDAALRCCMECAGDPPGELAMRLLNCSDPIPADDATVVVISLESGGREE